MPVTARLPRHPRRFPRPAPCAECPLRAAARSGVALLLAVAAIAAAAAPAAAQSPRSDSAAGLEPRGNLAALAPFLGHWELTTTDLRPDGSRVEGRATSHAYLTLDGYALLDDFRALGPDGEVVFRGTSVRTAHPSGDGFLIRWLMVDDPGYTLIRARLEDGDLVGEGRGVDAVGDFLERFRYTFDGTDAYRFTLDRSYDGGETWIEDFGVIEARRVAGDRPRP